MRLHFILALGLALTAALVTVSAQTLAIPTSVDVLVLPATGDAMTMAPVVPPRTTPIAAATNCNIATIPSGNQPLVNPQWVYFDDPFNAGRFCRGAIPAALPVGQGYRAVAILTAPTCSTGTPCPSLRSSVGTPPFDIAVVLSRPAPAAGLVVR